MALTKRLRYEILRRDNHTCRYCGGVAPDVTLTVDHVLPVALGGTDDAGNLVAACRDCNAGKSASNPDAPLVAQVADDAIRWAAAVAKAAELAEADRYADVVFAFHVSDAWDNYTYGFKKLPIPKPDDWENSLYMLRRRGLTEEAAVWNVEVTMKHSEIPPAATWRYYMGVCWRTLDEQNKIAKQIYDASTVEGAGT